MITVGSASCFGCYKICYYITINVELHARLSIDDLSVWFGCTVVKKVVDCFSCFLSCLG